MDQALATAITELGLDEGAAASLEAAEKQHGPVVNWPQSRFADVLGPLAGTAVHAVVRAAKVPDGERHFTGRRELPEKPPYLDVDKNGVPVGYDPADPTQFWTDPETGELWRWDGKRAHTKTKNALGQPVEPQPFPYGQPHRVAVVPHTTVDGVAIPDPAEASKADLAGFDWFHRGYGVWLGNGGKAYRDVSMERRRRVKDAQARVLETGNPVIVRR